jgi:hypothetical protein
MKTVCAVGLFFVALLSLLAIRQSPLQQVDIVVNPFGVSPLSAVCEISSTRPVKVEQIAIEGVRTLSYSSDYSRRHSIPLSGLSPGLQTLSLTLLDEEGRQVYCPDTEVTAAPFPRDLPEIRVLQSEPGLEGYLFCQLEGPSHAYQLLMTPLGQVVWLRARPPRSVLGRWLPNGRLLNVNFPAGFVETEDINGRRLASNPLSLEGLSPTTMRVESAGRAWILDNDEVVGLDLAGGSKSSVSAFSLLGIHPTQTGPAWAPGNTLVLSPELVAELNPAGRRVEWLVGDPRSLHPNLLPFSLAVEEDLYPRETLACLWAKNLALLTAEREQQVVLREYLVDLSERKMVRNWSYPLLSGGKVDSVLLCESFQQGRIGVALNMKDSARLKIVTQDSEPKTLLDIEIEGGQGWSVSCLQLVASMF